MYSSFETFTLSNMLFHRVGPWQRWTGLGEVLALKNPIAPFDGRTQNS
jgi:hypothetical protein